ncbi:MAG: hypothetical protein K9G61_06075, partial [Bacteroidales bacterium]|nr:hypothetical protein [Bacteroidales bacterium]
MKKLNLFIFIVLSLTFVIELPAQKVECFILKAPETPFYNMNRIGVLEFDCTNNRRKSVVMTNFVVGDLL